ncbi:MAG: hypothetical protein WDA06_00935 [Phenylobacterium sp.]
MANHLDSSKYKNTQLKINKINNDQTLDIIWPISKINSNNDMYFYDANYSNYANSKLFINAYQDQIRSAQEEYRKELVGTFPAYECSADYKLLDEMLGELSLSVEATDRVVLSAYNTRDGIKDILLVHILTIAHSNISDNGKIISIGAFSFDSSEHNGVLCLGMKKIDISLYDVDVEYYDDIKTIDEIQISFTKNGYGEMRSICCKAIE